ncbi:MAG: FtsH protease activity modulator HflK [Clostridiaceae bacterium]|nr:FtsH protease activity modulator HflK [Clostridiaceae bacterium]
MDVVNARNVKKLPVKVIVGVVILIAAVVVFSNLWYTVYDQEQAVVLTFGEVTGIEGAGMHLKFPDPIQSVIKVPVQKRQQLTLGYRDKGNNQYESVDDEAKMITGDFNIVKIDFYIEWKISDPRKYLFEAKNPENILRNAGLSAARSVVGSSGIDEVLTSGKIAIQSEIKDKLIKNLEMYDIGVQLIDVKIQDSEAPTEQVKEAFRNVENAKQGMETAINEANQYKYSEIPKAEAEADRIVRNAESQKETRINDAKGQVAKFQKMYEEYKNYKDITKTRLYLEAMEEILPGVQVYVEDNSGSIQKLVPLKPFNSQGGE